MPKPSSIKTVGVVGAGTMGRGIALAAAGAGYSVMIFDVEGAVLPGAMKEIDRMLQQSVEKNKISNEEKSKILSRINAVSILKQMKVDLVVEAVVEKLEVKQKLFKELEAINEKLILATNTSSIPVTQIASALKNPDRCVGLHFFNPAHLMKLVEVIAGTSTDPEVVLCMVDFAKSLGKIPVLAKDSPGFIVNRVARHYYVESLKLVEEGVAGIEDVDKLMRSAGFKMGPFELMDLIGVDTNFSVTTSMYESFFYDPKFRPSRIQQQKVMAGHWGRKSGKGFYEYPKQ